MKRMKHYSIFLLMATLLQIWAIGNQASAVQLSVESKTGRPGDHVQIAVRTDNTTGLGIISVQFLLTFNGSILTVRSASTTGTIASSWGAPTFNPQTGQISISMAGATPLSGNGNLVILEFDVSPSASSGQTTQLNITQLQLNEGSVPGTVLPGTFTVTGGGGAQATLTVESANTTPGAQVTIAVSISDATELGIISMQMDLDFTSSLLTATNVSNTGTITQSWGTPTASIQSGKVRISMAGSAPLSGTGTIFLVTFRVASSATNGQSSPLTLSQVSINEGAISATLVNGRITIGGDDQVQLAFPASTVVTPGASVSVPLSITNATGKNIIAASLSVTYTSSFATAVEVSLADGVVPGWTPASNVTSGRITIAIAGTSAIPNDGELLRIRFNISNNITPGSSSPLNIQDVVLNDGNIPFTVQNGILQVQQNNEISGAVRYYFNNQGVRNVKLQLSGAASNMQNSATDGTYRFGNILAGNYTLTPGKDGDIASGVISHFDASMILRSIVGSLNLTQDQEVAADVDGNDIPQALDAALILQYQVGIITQFPVGEDWVFSPENFTYMPLSSSQANQDFKAFVYGDVSGNYMPSLSLSQLEVSSTVKVSLPDTLATDTTRINIPLTIEGNTNNDIFSFGGKILFNPKVLVIKSAQTQNTIASSWGNPTAKFDTAEVAFAIAGTSPLQGNGTLLLLEFDIIGNSQDTSGLYFQDFMLNEGIPSADVHSGLVSIGDPTPVEERSDQIPQRFYLWPNYPNPFNPETIVRFELPKSAHVRLEIFNILGHKIRTLLDENKLAGLHSAVWDGRNNGGELVASGVYIYQIMTRQYKQSRKLSLIR